jgi:hypothetical protein
LALTTVVVDAINASASVLAWFGSALINVDFTVFTLETGLAFAYIRGDQIVADSTVLTYVVVRAHSSQLLFGEFE